MTPDALPRLRPDLRFRGRLRNLPAAAAKNMRVLHILGILFIVSWLVLWLALKITFAAIHALVIIGILLILGGLVAGRSRPAPR